MISLIGSIVGGIFGIGKDYITHKQKITEAKRQVELETIQSRGDWEEKMAEASGSSWKDEWFTVMISVPIITLWCGVMFDSQELIERSQEAFNMMATLPEWYWYLLGIAFSASFGLKPAVKGISGLFKAK